MYLFYNYLNVFSAPAFCLYALGAGSSWLVAAFVLAFIVHPLSDLLINNFFKKKFFEINGGESKSWAYHIPLYLAVPFQLLLVAVAFSVGSVSLIEALMAGTLCGLSGGILGAGTSHEMTHRNNKWERRYGYSMLFAINYPYFHLEHIWHHAAIGTEKDPDTARQGESVYKFLFRSIPQGWMDCWRTEGKRLRNENEKYINLKNRMFALTLSQVLIMLSILMFLGALPLLVYATQGIVTIILLKWINYIEHYGLTRKRAEGKLESIGFHHSWDSSSALTNFSLFNLGFHSQHHAKPNIKYYELPKGRSNWNELPAGYSAMMMLALVPPLYMKTMGDKIKTLESNIYV